MACSSMLVLLALAFVPFVLAQDIVGCGGFVEASPGLAKLRKPTDPKLDYSHTTVKLLTPEGLVKDKTQCAPNGYYFLPVYEEGSFVLKIEGPSGWSSTPSQVPVVVDQHGCNSNEDINFRYTGFMISGVVVGAIGGKGCKAAGDGPSGVSISLSGPDGSALSVLTGPSGLYSFQNLTTGTYTLEAIHPTLEIVPRTQEIEVEWDNARAAPFSVPGYVVEGSVLSKGNPVLGVQVFLHSQDVSEVFCPEGQGSSLPKDALCVSVSNNEGRFKFKNVPCGTYTLVPFYKGENTVFDVSPAAIDISVEHESIVVEPAFQVTGFSVGGRVIDLDGRGIANVKIFVDSVERAITDADGMYKLDQVTSTTYTITASKTHYKFTSLPKFMVLPNMVSLPDIKPAFFDVCGSVRVLTNSAKCQVAVTHGPSDVKPQTKRVDNNGDFCFEVPPGDYRLSPLPSSTERKDGLLFSPQYLDISVKAPVLGLVFSQAQVSVSGYVKCKSVCDSRVTVTLTSARAGAVHDKLQTRVNENSEFVFDKVFPGQYVLEISASEAGEPDDWCWENKQIKLEVLTGDIKDIVFVQKGYWLRIESTHATSAYIVQEGGDPVTLQITKGLQEVCLHSPGTHVLHFVKPCVWFGASTYSFDTSNIKPIQLTGRKYLLTGSVHLSSPVVNDVLHVDVFKGHEQVADILAVPIGDGTSEYEYTFWAEMDEELRFSPRLEGSTSSMLFYPKGQKFLVRQDGCQPKIPDFFGRSGLYISGSVVPAVKGVNITLTALSDSKFGPLKAGQMALYVSTGEDGKYSAGPLFDDTDYTVHAEKAGYHLKSIGDYSFSCQKLAEIVVHILPGEGAEDAMPPVLLSLSGDDGYRKNAPATPGVPLVFSGLFPGSFYLRPLLKEYLFNPTAQAIELSSGEKLRVSFTARRSAYSIYGIVSGLSGKPEQGILVESRSQSGDFYEDATTDRDGKYRLRGLLPQRTYNVRVVIKEDLEGLPRLERASPSVYPVQVLDNDTFGVDFVVFEHSPTGSISGIVVGEDIERWRSGMFVQAVPASEPHRIEQEVPLPLSNFFELRELPRGKYIVRVASKDAGSMRKFHSDVKEVDLRKKTSAFLDALHVSTEDERLKQDFSAAPILPAVVGVLVIAFLSTVPSIKDAYQRGFGAAAHKDVRKSNNPVRRTKTL